jgi:ribosome maturation factor RimP
LSRHDDLDRLRDAAARVAGTYGLDIFDVQFRREASGWVLRVILDRPERADPGAAGPGESVSIADCQRVSQDVAGPGPAAA